MKFRLTALLAVIPAVIAALLVSTPAEAATPYTVVKSKIVVIDAAGNGAVYVACTARTTCRGSLAFGYDSAKRSYSIPARSSKYVAIHASGAANPQDGTTAGTAPRDYKYKTGQIIVDRAASPRSGTKLYNNVRTEEPVKNQTLRVTTEFDGSPQPGNVRVDLVTVARGGNPTYRELAHGQFANGDSYDGNIALGINNSASGTYYLRIRGTDQDGERRQWFWRGSSNNASFGGKNLSEASPIRLGKDAPFIADFHTDVITANVNNSAGPVEVTVAAPPTTYSGAVFNRDLDLLGCANIFGETTVADEGSKTINFLPYGNGSKHYLVSADDHSSNPVRWNGTSGSCWDALSYNGSTAKLVSPSATVISTFGPNDNSVVVRPYYKPSGITQKGDGFVRLREKIPGQSILDSAVIADGSVSGVAATFTNLPAGQYWVEIGRRTGCSSWLPSRYSNNTLYLKGEDRGAEAWKTVAGTYAERTKSYQMGFVAKRPPSGYKGWMYRGYCGAVTAGAYSTMTVTASDDNQAPPTMRVWRGATVSGKVTRGGGRTNKEMMVSFYPTGSKARVNVIRTDLTDSSGRFSVKGLATGTYRIVVNADSWRGITRAFSGKQSIKVTAGKSYSVGTLRFQNQADKADTD